ncbi:MAG: peptide chain release factor-like protein, partial [Planctomycetota bacterium]
MDDELTWRPGRPVPMHEISFEMDAAGGPGGQHANRSATRVSLVWVPADSEAFSDREKERIQEHLKTRINQRGELRLRSSEERSAAGNRRHCLELLVSLLQQALTIR